LGETAAAKNKAKADPYGMTTKKTGDNNDKYKYR
jgi:hypothetical protein